MFKARSKASRSQKGLSAHYLPEFVVLEGGLGCRRRMTLYASRGQPHERHADYPLHLHTDHTDDSTSTSHRIQANSRRTGWGVFCCFLHLDWSNGQMESRVVSSLLSTGVAPILAMMALVLCSGTADHHRSRFDLPPDMSDG